MTVPARVVIAVTALLHVYIAWFEIFAWTSVGPDTFDTIAPELFPQTTELAANQGVYNAFLAAGLIWSLVIRDRVWNKRIATCFLLFVLIAGIAAAVTLELSNGLPQTVPAVAGLLALHVPRPEAGSDANVA